MKYDNRFTIKERNTLISDFYKSLRKSKGLTQKEVASALNIATQTYSSYEKGRTETPAEILVRLSYLYDISLDILMQRENMCKDILTTKEELSRANKEIDGLKEALNNKDILEKFDDNTRNQLKQIVDGLSQFTQGLEGITNKIDNEE